MNEKRELIELAGRVSDGAGVDWEAAERQAADDDERRLVHNLRLVDSLARVHEASEPPQSSATGLEQMTNSIAGVELTEQTVAARPAGPGAPHPESWGSLEIREQVGAGAFGEVYRAWDPNLDREVALKLLKKEPSARHSLASTVIREGRLLARVDHPNVVTVHGAETHDGRVGLWMEFVRGRSLEELLNQQGTFGAREAALLGVDLCRALAAVHQAGLVHRDVKTQNVMRRQGGRVLLMDFGAVRDLHALERHGGHVISGTPLYIAPELFAGQPATPRSDIYSLGVLLFRMVAGTFPVQAASLDELKEKHARRDARLLRDVRSDLPEPFVRIVERALAWDPEERYASAGQMQQALSAALGVEQGEASASRHRRSLLWPAVGVAAAIALLLAAIFTVELWKPRRGVAGTPDTAAPTAEPSTGGALPADAYTVEAALMRVGARGTRERLDSGARLELGDRLTLEFEASRAVFVYVINEDDQGRAFALFPLPDLELQNPLPGGVRHRLPGNREGRAVSWQVDTPGGREHLLVLASPERLTDFEAEMNRLAPARPDQVAVPIPADARVRLRGIGALAEIEPPGDGDPAGRLFEMAEQLAGPSETVRGAWFRRIELQNPRP